MLDTKQVTVLVKFLIDSREVMVKHGNILRFGGTRAGDTELDEEPGDEETAAWTPLMLSVNRRRHYKQKNLNFSKN